MAQLSSARRLSITDYMKYGGLAAAVVGVGAVASFGVVGTNISAPSNADYQRRDGVVLQIQSLESDVRLYWASVNIGSPLAGVEAPLAYCANPHPAKLQTNAAHLCNLVSQRQGLLEEYAAASEVIEEKRQSAAPWGQKMLYAFGGTVAALVVSLIGIKAGGAKPYQNYRKECAAGASQ